MKRIFISALFIVVMTRTACFAGFLGGNTSPNVEEAGLYAVKLNTAIVMTGTPFTAICLTGKYAYDSKLSLMGKVGQGSLDYSTTGGFRVTYTPQIFAAGVDYLLGGARDSQYYSFISEFETVTWGINWESNTSDEIMVGMDFCGPYSENPRTRYRVGIHNFNAGSHSGDEISTSTKYSLSTELEYRFSRNLRSSFEGGIYFGDQNGLVSYFGLGFSFNS